MPRVIAGKYKGLNLKSLKGDHTRPSADRLKEAFFSIVQARLPGADFLDLFSGSGQMGIEALSRGARRVVFCEKQRAAFRVLQENLKFCHLERDETEVKCMDARKLVRLMQQDEQEFDLIYLDPPWQEAIFYLACLQEDLKKLLKPGGLIIWEVDRHSLKAESKWCEEALRTCHYGRAVLLFYNDQGSEEKYRDE